jgi:hypothetical protein
MLTRRCPSGYYISNSGNRCVKASTRRKKCSPGKILRASYVRRIGTAVREKGYTRKTKTGKIIRVFPKGSPTFVSASCIINQGAKGKGTQKIGPLRSGELTKLGYSSRLSVPERHAALKRAIKKFGANNVFHKLDAVAKLSARTHPASAATFRHDRNWVRNHYDISVKKQ